MLSKYLNRGRLLIRAAKMAVSSRFISHKPFFISHRITGRCNCLCKTCLWRGNFNEEKNTVKIIKAYERAYSAGFVSTTFWGGEPLIRNDIEEITAACKRTGFTVGLITNGYYLPEKAERLSKTLDFLIVSIDLPSEKHDLMRGINGLFERAIEGIKQAKLYNPKLKVFVNSVVSQLNYPEVIGMAKLAQKLDISVTFESTNTGKTLDGSKEVNLRLKPEIEKQAFEKIMFLKREGLPINNSYSYLRMFAAGRTIYKCYNPKVSIGVAPDGSISTCFAREKPIGNFYVDDISRIILHPDMIKFRKMAESCSSCVDTGAIECSFFYSLVPEVILNTIRLFYR
ncbi:MAG: radical SAM protein [Planctomycetota bacterium]